MSDGILQYHRHRKARRWFWDMDMDMDGKVSGITGSPILPSDTIRMKEMGCTTGFIGHSSCAHIMKLIPSQKSEENGL